MADNDGTVLNFNVGVLGHVDSGKTSLARALSCVASTACFDKHRQSQERGITIDLGFSSFSAPPPPSVLEAGYSRVQYTLVDCPGHASLIRTIIGGAQIIDLMLLVVDVTRGVQTQTAECLVIGEVFCRRRRQSPGGKSDADTSANPHAESALIVVLNKCDLLPPDQRSTLVRKMTRRLLATLQTTAFAADAPCPVVAVSACPSVTEGATVAAQPADCASGDMSVLMEAIVQNTYVPTGRCCSAPLVMSVDHCFGIRGQGTVLTGTIVQGTVAVNDTVEIASLKLTRKVKSLQVFRRAVTRATAGARLGLCVTQLEPGRVERCLLAAPGYLTPVQAAIVRVRRIAYYRGRVASKTRYHITLGHETVVGELRIFVADKEALTDRDDQDDQDDDGEQGRGAGVRWTFDASLPRQQLPHIPDNDEQANVDNDDVEGINQDVSLLPNKQLNEQQQENNNSVAGLVDRSRVWYEALLVLERAVVTAADCRLVGSRLDMDCHTPSCRLAFHGRLVQPLSISSTIATTADNTSATAAALCGQQLRGVYKIKRRCGVVERALTLPDASVNNLASAAGDGCVELIVRGLFKKEADWRPFDGMRVRLSSGQRAIIAGGFGQSGKVKVLVQDELDADTRQCLELLSAAGKRRTASSHQVAAPSSTSAGAVSKAIRVHLQFRCYVYDKHRRVSQQ